MTEQQRPTLVVVGPYGRRFWEQMLAALDGRLDVIVDDLGCGGDLAKMAARISAQAPARFALLGFCMGGYLAFELMRFIPERISRLALINTGPRADPPAQAQARAERIEKLRRKAAFMPFPDEPYVEQAAEWLVSASSRRSAATIRAVRDLISGIPLSRSADQQQAMLHRADSRSTLARIDVPTLIVGGRDDRVIPSHQAQEMADQIPHAEVHILGCGHLAPLEAPAELAALIAQWLAPEFEDRELTQMTGERHVAAG